MLESLKQVLKKSLPEDVIKFRRDLEARREWEKQGRPSPPPHIVKEELIRDYAKTFKTNVLIETGTYLGDRSSERKVVCEDSVI